MLCSVNQFKVLLHAFTLYSGRRVGDDSDDEDLENQSIASHPSTGTHSGDEGLSAFNTCMRVASRKRV